MKANDEDIETIKELLRHSNYKVTAGTYTEAVTPRAASNRSPYRDRPSQQEETEPC